MQRMRSAELTGLHAVEASANARRGHRCDDWKVRKRSGRLVRSRREEHPTGAHAVVARRLLEDRTRRRRRCRCALSLAAVAFLTAARSVSLVVRRLLRVRRVGALALRWNLRQTAAQDDLRLELRLTTMSPLFVAPAVQRDAGGERVAGARERRGRERRALVVRVGSGSCDADGDTSDTEGLRGQADLRLVHKQQRVRELGSRGAAGARHELRSRRATRRDGYCCGGGGGDRCGAHVRTANSAQMYSETIAAAAANGGCGRSEVKTKYLECSDSTRTDLLEFTMYSCLCALFCECLCSAAESRQRVINSARRTALFTLREQRAEWFTRRTHICILRESNHLEKCVPVHVVVDNDADLTCGSRDRIGSDQRGGGSGGGDRLIRAMDQSCGSKSGPAGGRDGRSGSSDAIRRLRPHYY